jgi:hypothetical protein
MQFEEVNSFHDSMQGYLRDMRPVIEIYKASHTKLFPNEDILNKINMWSSILLKEEISMEQNSQDQTIFQEVPDHRAKYNLDIHISFIFMFSVHVLSQVKFALHFPFYANLDRLEHKRSIERFNFGKFWMLKASHM